MMLKADARILYKEKRQALSPAERAKLDDLLLIQLQTVQLPFITFLLSIGLSSKIKNRIHIYLQIISNFKTLN